MSIFSIFKRNERLAESVEQLNAAHKSDGTLFADYLTMRFALLDIADLGSASKSGTARKLAKIAEAALK